MLFAHLKPILKLDRLRLPGPTAQKDECREKWGTKRADGFSMIVRNGESLPFSASQDGIRC